MPYADENDVSALNPFPKVGASSAGAPRVAPEQVRAWCQMRSSELDLALRLKGLDVPVSEPPELVDLLRMAVTYGAAAMLESAPKVRRDDTEVNLYLQEYIRIKDWIEARTREELLGANLITGSQSTPTPPGLSLSRNTAVARQCPQWYDRYPVRLVEE